MNQWLNVQENYFLHTDKEGYIRFIRERKKDLIIDIEILQIDLLYNLYLYNDIEAENKLKEYGISGNIEQIKRRIKQKQTKYKLRMEERNKNSKKTAENDYYKMLSLASKKFGYHIPSDILLPEWCSKLILIKEMNE